jgi:predicted transcriptional regulator
MGLFDNLKKKKDAKALGLSVEQYDQYLVAQSMNITLEAFKRYLTSFSGKYSLEQFAQLSDILGEK